MNYVYFSLAKFTYITRRMDKIKTSDKIYFKEII